MTTTDQQTAISDQYRIKIIHDSDARNPFKEDDGNFPLIFESGRSNGEDFSEGEIDSYLQSFLSVNQIIYHQKRILKLLDDKYLNEDVKNAENSNEKLNLIGNALDGFISENIENKVNFCNEFKIMHYHGNSTGYSQGDWADVLIVPTAKNAKLLGYDLAKITERDLKCDFDLFGYWAWGDVYGFRIEKNRSFTKIYHDNGESLEDEEWEEVDSCWGFFGRDGERNGMIDNIDYSLYGWTITQLIELINDAEVSY